MSKPFALRQSRAQPEAAFQRQCVALLRAYLPPEVKFTASLAGINLSPANAGLAKAMGNNPGFPDLSFVLPDGSTVYVELKTQGGTLTPEQKALGSTLGDAFAVCRTWPEVKTALTGWLEPHGLRLLTDTESVRRHAASRGFVSHGGAG